MNHCPYLDKECIRHDCMHFVHFTCKDPQTGRDRDEWTCTHALIPILLMENANQIRQVAASVDSMRNEVVQRQDILNTAAVLGRQSKAIGDIYQQHNVIEGR